MHSLTLTTRAVACIPYEGYEELETPGGEVVTGLDVCAEFEDACSCEAVERVLHGVVDVASDGGCFSWKLLRAEFWTYVHGTVCPSERGWTLEMDAYPGEVCGLVIEPQVDWSILTRMEVVCEWDSDDGTHVVDRLLFQYLPSPGAFP